METSQLYILVSIVVLAIAALLIFLIQTDRTENRLKPLDGLAFGFILAGILFGEGRPLGYSLLGIGVLLAVVDMVNRSHKRV